MKTTKLILAIAITSLFFSCGKDGATGPQGPSGMNGNANVQGASGSVTSWNNNGTIYYTTFTDGALTSAVQSTGAVEVFLSTDNASTWKALPFTEVSGTDYIMLYHTSVGSIEIDWIYNGAGLGSDPNTYYSATCQFKIVCIASSIIKQHPNTNWTNYNEVMQILTENKSSI
jgi:hypothetical protein